MGQSKSGSHGKEIFAILIMLFCLAGCGGSGGGGTTIQTPTAATPTFSPAAGTYTSAQSVTLGDSTTGASIYYTTDGSTPTATSSLYSKPITVSVTTTITAIAILSGYNNSALATGTFTINLPAAATPTFTPLPGTFTSAQSVTIADATTGAQIYYTIDGSMPTSSSTLYTAPIGVAATTTVNAIATASGYSTSAVATGTFTITEPTTATPTFSPAPGTFNAAQTVTLGDTTAGAQIYYTTDGSKPTTSSTLYSTAISVSADTTLNAIATAPGNLTSAVATGAYTINGPAVAVVLSTHDQTQLMAAQPSVNFTVTSAGTNKIIVDETQKYQTIEGFGAAFTDSAAYLLNEVAQPAQLTSIMSDLFTRNGAGIGLSFMRIPMGATDIARSVYSFDDQPVGQTDFPLAGFSIAHDQADVLPIILQAKALNPQMKLMANPWSPPGWMKDPASMSPVSMLGGTLLLTPANETAFANYFVKYVQAYQAAGVPIDYISLQNEPLNITTSYPSMGMSGSVQLGVLRDYVLPALAANNITSKVFVYDHNWDAPSYPETVFADSTVLASSLVAGTAWHGYGGPPGAQQTLQNMFPSKGNWETEHSGGTFISDQFINDFVEIPHVLRNAGKSYVKWSLALDENLGPNLTQNAGLGGCNTCTPIVTVNSTTGDVTKDIEYYTLGHFSKYLLNGATRIYSSNGNGLDTVAFENPDTSKVLFVFNNSSASQTFQAQWGTNSLSYTLPSLGAATFSWTGTQSGSYTVPATSQIEGSSYSSESGLQTETTSDSTGGYDLGYLSPNSYALYENIDFGASVGTVYVREASDGNGGTATFYLDSVNSTPIATVDLPVTGGWQTWQTVIGMVSGASGVHNLYVVFTGGGTSGSIANVNWFQFQ
jgi:glucosylceramidase